MKKTLGILGGMGPAATCDLMEKIISLTAAEKDQDHIHVIADVNTNIPDRTAAILHGGDDPAPEMIRSAQRLAAAGAELLLLPCNTAHYFYDRVAAAVSVPILHMPRLTAASLREAGVKRAAILATEGTVRSSVYEAALRAEGVEPLYPDDADEDVIMRLIYDGVKARRTDLAAFPVRGVLDRLRARGAEKFVLGCTELPIAFRELGLRQDCVDPTRILAFAAVRAAGAETTAEHPW